MGPIGGLGLKPALPPLKKLSPLGSGPPDIAKPNLLNPLTKTRLGFQASEQSPKISAKRSPVKSAKSSGRNSEIEVGRFKTSFLKQNASPVVSDASPSSSPLRAARSGDAAQLRTAESSYASRQRAAESSYAPQQGAAGYRDVSPVSPVRRAGSTDADSSISQDFIETR